MLTALDANDHALDEHERGFVAKVRDHGWSSTTVFSEGDEPGFSYTTGFWVSLGKPEIIVFGMATVIHDVLWDLYRDLKDGRELPVGQPVLDVFANIPACFMPVDRALYKQYLGWDRWFYAGDSFPCLQLVWPDRAGVFPWQPDMSSEFAGMQPDLSPQGWATAATSLAQDH
jgi:hypothetical protein